MKRKRDEHAKEFNLLLTLLVGALALLSLVPRLKAEPTGQAGNFLALGIGARTLAIGNACTAVCDDPTASLWNPAGLTRLRYREMDAMHTWIDIHRDLNHFGMGLPLTDTSTIGFNWSQFRVGSIPETSLDTTKQVGVDAQGNPIYDVKITGYFDDREDCLGISYAYDLGNNLALGSTLKYFRNTVHDNSASTLGLDLGFLFSPSPLFTLGLALRDLGENYTWNGQAGKNQSVPSTTAVGVALRPWKDLLLSGDVSKTRNRDIEICAGAEYELGDCFALRGGVLNGLVTAGLGFRVQGWSIDYAYANRQTGVEHRVSSNYRFGLPVRGGEKEKRGPRPLVSRQPRQPRNASTSSSLFAGIKTIGTSAATPFGESVKRGIKRIEPAN